MKFEIKHGLPFISLEVKFKGKTIQIDDVLIDTGSAGTLFKAEVMEKISIIMEPKDKIERIFGVGGEEFVFLKNVDEIQINGFSLSYFTLEIGAVNYPLQMNGILGTDFLMAIGAKIDFKGLEIN